MFDLRPPGVSSNSSHHLEEVLLAQFSLHVQKGGIKPQEWYIGTLAKGRGPAPAFKFLKKQNVPSPLTHKD